MIKTFVLKLWKWYKGHEGVSDAHHTKYTDAEAVTAVNTDDAYLKNTGDICTGDLSVKKVSPNLKIESTNPTTHSNMLSFLGANRPGFYFKKQNTGQEWCMVMGTSDKWFIKPAAPHTVPTDTDSMVCFHTNGNTGLGDFSGVTPSRTLDINDSRIRVRIARTPASAGGSGYQGDICWDANYVYVCVATNTWKRSAIATW